VFLSTAGHANGVFVRVADGDRKLNSYEVQMMLALRGQPADDQSPVTGSTLKNLDESAIREFLRHVRMRRRRFRDATDEHVLRSLKVLVPEPDENGALVPSIAGILAFGREPQAFFPQFSILVTAYPGREIGERGAYSERMLDDARIEGSIGTMLTQSLTVIQRNLRQTRRSTGPTRVTNQEFPVSALSEAVVNALAHRDLSPQSRGTAVQIQLFADRLVITNPGGLYGPVSIDTLGAAGVTSARNATLMQLLEDAIMPGTGEAIVEHRGTGVAVMVQALREADMSPPRFEDGIGTFRVTFPRQSLIDPQVLKWLADLGPSAEGLSRDQRMALALMKTGESLSNARYRQLGGADSRVASRELADLVARRLVDMGGGGRYTAYSLASASEESSFKTKDNNVRSKADRRPQIRALLEQKGEISRADMQTELGLRQAIVSRWLKRMLEAGEIEHTTKSEKSPETKYRLRKRDV
jgi:ATP-dependent DNA helicase RecG